MHSGALWSERLVTFSVTALALFPGDRPCYGYASRRAHLPQLSSGRGRLSRDHAGGRFAFPAALCVLSAINAHDPTRPVLLTQAARGAMLPAIRQGTRRDGSAASVLSTRTYSMRDPADENLARVVDDARAGGSPPSGS